MVHKQVLNEFCCKRLVKPYLQNDIGSGHTAPPAEADFHIVQATVTLGDVPDLGVSVTLGHRLPCRTPMKGGQPREKCRRNGEKEWKGQLKESRIKEKVFVLELMKLEELEPCWLWRTLNSD